MTARSGVPAALISQSAPTFPGAFIVPPMTSASATRAFAGMLRPAAGEKPAIHPVGRRRWEPERLGVAPVESGVARFHATRPVV